MGVLPVNFELEGNRILLIEDAVQEARTLGVMMSTLNAMQPGLEFSLFALDIEDNEETRLGLQPVKKIFKFEA
jgi:hypoxanthine-guanine phosphoribosyltransferase